MCKSVDLVNPAVFKNLKGQRERGWRSWRDLTNFKAGNVRIAHRSKCVLKYLWLGISS